MVTQREHKTSKAVRRNREWPEAKGPYYITKDGIIIRGFNSFYEAYMHALNKFCSEDFLVQKEE